MLSFWSDPIWKGLRIISLISASVTLIVVIVYLSGVHSWRVTLVAVVATNFGIFVALVIRTLILRSKSRHARES